MEKNMAKNVLRWQSQKDTSGKPKINADTDNSACQASNVMLMECRQGTSENIFVHLNVNIQKMQDCVKIPSWEKN